MALPLSNQRLVAKALDEAKATWTGPEVSTAAETHHL